MEDKLKADRWSRELVAPRLQSRSRHIDQIQASFGYDRENAEKVYEIMQVRSIEFLFGSACGVFAAYKVGPLQKELARANVIFRKSWMRYPLQLTTFGLAYMAGIQVPARFVRKFFVKNNDGINDDVARGSHDLVSRFRLNEHREHINKEDQIMNYLSMYSSDPLSKPELVESMMKNIAKDIDLS